MPFIIVLIGIVVVLFLLMPILFVGAPFLPSLRKQNSKDLNEIINLLWAEGARTCIDIGSGDGRIVIAFAQHGFESHGVEINPLLFLWSRYQIKKHGLTNAHIYWGDFWKKNLKEYNVVYSFHFAFPNRQLQKKLHNELLSNSWVVSVGFPLSGMTLIKNWRDFFVYKK